jgi:hypothetical protein
MRALLALILPSLCLQACQCSPDDGWPHLEDHRWRTVLDPAGAHSFTDRPSAPLAVLHRGDGRESEALLVGYRDSARGTLRASDTDWVDCEGPVLPGGMKLAEPSDSPDHPGVAWLGPATQVEIPTPPGNPSETLLMARDRIAGLMGPGTGEDVQVRSLIKQRRPKAPPVLLVTGDAGCQGIVAVLDAEGEPLFSELLPLPGPRCAPLAAMPPADIDGDGRRELTLRAGNGEPGVGVFRAVYRVDLDGPAPSLERTWHESFVISCR